MTNDENPTPDAPENPAASTSATGQLPFLADAPELLRVRVLPAEFARLLGVSKQAVSRWIAKGHVTVNAVDGRLDVTEATRQVLRNTDPGRLRARVLRAAVADVQDLRQAVVDADARVAAQQARIAALDGRVADLEAALADARAELELADRANGEFLKLLAARQADFRDAAESDLDDLFVELLDDALAAALASLAAERAAARQAAIDADPTGLAAVEAALAALDPANLPEIDL